MSYQSYISTYMHIDIYVFYWLCFFFFYSHLVGGRLYSNSFNFSFCAKKLQPLFLYSVMSNMKCLLTPLSDNLIQKLLLLLIFLNIHIDINIPSHILIIGFRFNYKCYSAHVPKWFLFFSASLPYLAVFIFWFKFNLHYFSQENISVLLSPCISRKIFLTHEWKLGWV